MCAFVDRQVDGAGIAGRELGDRALQHTEFVLDIFIRAEAHRESSVIGEAGVGRIRQVDDRDLGRHVAREQLAEDRRQIRDLRRIGLTGVEHLADLRLDRRNAVDPGKAGQLALRDGFEQLAVLVQNPVTAIRLNIGHGAALLDRDGDAVGQRARDLRFVHIRELAEDAAGSRETVDEKQIVARADAGGLDDLLGRVDGVAHDLDLCNTEKYAHAQDERRADQQKDQRLQQRPAPAAGWAAGPARAARPGLLRLFHRQVIPFTAAPRSAHRPQAPTGTHRSGRSRG